MPTEEDLIAAHVDANPLPKFKTHYSQMEKLLTEYYKFPVEDFMQVAAFETEIGANPGVRYVWRIRGLDILLKVTIMNRGGELRNHQTEFLNKRFDGWLHPSVLGGYLAAHTADDRHRPAPLPVAGQKRNQSVTAT